MKENNAAQPALTDDEIRTLILERIGNVTQALREDATEFARAIESALLSKLRAPVADERVKLPPLPEPRVIYNGEDDLDEEVYDGDQMKEYARAALASAPASEDGLTAKQAWWAGYRAGKGLPPDTPRQDAVKVDISSARLVTHWPNGTPRDERDTASDPEGKLIHDPTEPLLAASATVAQPWPVEEQPDGTVTPVDPVDMASAPVAGEAQRESEALRQARHDSANAKTERERVLALAGWLDQQKFEPEMLSCAAATLRAMLSRDAAPQASAEDVRNAALEEAAHLMEQTGKRIAASDIRALKQPQEGEDGGQQRAGDVANAADAARYRLAVADCILILRGDAALGRAEWDSKLDNLAKAKGEG